MPLAMPTISELKQKGELPPAEMDEVIERAARLQEQARAGKRGFSVDEVKAVGQELDIDPRFVDAALEQLRTDRQQAAQAAQQARARRNRLLKVGGAALGALLAVSFLVGWAGAGSVRSAGARAEVAQSALTAVLDRQVALIPQLLALGGGAAADVEAPRRRLQEAGDLPARTAAANDLQLAMANALARLPVPGDPALAQMRLSLQHELVGAQNRITIERRRYEEARAAWRAAAEAPSGRLAVAFGLARAP
jgi:hypothetical protein